MPRKETINEQNGKEISDLEALLIVMNHLLENKLKEKPAAGITLAKGKPNERRVRYKDARALLRGLEGYFGSRGCISIGVCETCLSLSRNGHGSPYFGTCNKTGKLKHVWDTCLEHSKEGGGYGA